MRRVVNFGMELHGVRFFAGYWMAATALEDLPTSSKPGGSSSASSPCDIQTATGLEALEQRRIVAQRLDFGVPVLALFGGAHLAAQLVHHELQAVADAEHGQPS